MNDKISELTSLPYEVILKRNDDEFVLFIPELSCFAKDKDLAKAYEKLESKKQELFHNAVESDLTKFIKEPYPNNKNRSIAYISSISAISSAAAILIVLFIVSIPSYFAIERVAEQFSVKNIYKFVVHKGDKITNALEQLPEDDKNKMRLTIRTSLKELKPFIDEFKILSQDQQ